MARSLGIEAYSSPVQESLINKNKLLEFKYIARESVVFILFLLFKV